MLHQGCTPDIVTYNSLINGLCKMGWMRAALNLLEKLHAEGLAPDMATYNTLISWHCKANMLDDASMLLNRAVNNGIMPNSLTWDILVNNFIREQTLLIQEHQRQSEAAAIPKT
ncbi:putative Pentatricopeptide repeat-containing protein, mitochondrial [Cocos nucifera]|uniref:Putative Pentatricopeptide repeat-containing protein, mitochondrial n=1 Tax=Cocos nucifera TaxID=13894 RepID=A0A8K0I874_COCNU|nr:putative Pentatricopeptide repeat-containing protein, mitochondrial [Cocos nucifera]